MASARRPGSAFGFDISPDLDESTIPAGQLPSAASPPLGRKRASNHAGELRSPFPIELLRALEELFGDDDRFFGSQECEIALSVLRSNQQRELSSGASLRIDGAQRLTTRSRRRSQSADDLTAAVGGAQAFRQLRAKGWSVVVVSGDEVLTDDAAQDVTAVSVANGRLLIVVCDNRLPADRRGSAANSDARSEPAWQFAVRCNVQYVGPVDGGNFAALARAISTIRSVGHASLLHVRVPVDASARSVLAGSEPQRRPDLVDVEPVLLAIHEELAFCAATASNIVASGPNQTSIQACWGATPQQLFNAGLNWQRALAWGRGVAHGGCRPFIVLPESVLAEHAGRICRDFGAVPTPATFLVYRDEDCVAQRVTETTHALLQSTGGAVAVPRNREELRQAIQWSLELEGPLVLYIPVLEEWSDRASRHNDVTGFGEASLIRQGEHVALLCCGREVAAAVAAAELLDKHGVAASVLDLRFTFPLDEESIAKTLSNVAMVVVLESEHLPGFSSTVLTKLSQMAVPKPVSLVGNKRPQNRRDAQDRLDRLTAEVVDACSWLASEVADSRYIRIDRPESAAPIRKSGTAPLQLFTGINSTYQDQHQIRSWELSASVEKWLRTYHTVGKRGLYFWKWCAFGADLTTLPGVDHELHKHVCDTKTLSIMLCVLLDDVADLRDKRDLLEAVVAVVSDGDRSHLAESSGDERYYIERTWQLTREYYERVRKYPRYAEFEDLLRFDQLQYFNTMRYSQLLNGQLHLLNATEHDLYMPHAMHMMSFATLDLMCMPQFCLSELGKVREIVWHAQCMGRIGNLLSTWRREINEQDFNSGVFARAVGCGDLSPGDLHARNAHVIEKAIVDGGHEQYFLHQLVEHGNSITSKAKHIESIDFSTFLDTHKRFFEMHWGSKGLI